MKKLFVVLSLVISLGILLHVTSSAEEKTVNATITPLVISIELSGTTFNYGVQQANSGEIVPTPEFITIKNTGTVTQKIQVKGANGTNNGWTLATSAGTDQYVHRFGLSTSSFTDLTTDYKALASNVQVNGEVPLYMRMVVPTVITKTAAQTLPVIILATAQ